MLTCIVTILPEEQFLLLFSETGFFEKVSILAWLIVALVILLTFPPRRRIHYGLSALFVMCSMREADWHKKFTTDGIFKLRYYTKSIAPLAEKIPAACVLLLFIGLTLYALISGFRYLRTAENRRNEAVWIMFIGIGLFFLGKILDRSSSLLEKSFNILVPSATKHYIAAYEEGFEMITPLVIALAFVWPKLSILPLRKSNR
jgi:hypothetical protein